MSSEYHQRIIQGRGDHQSMWPGVVCRYLVDQPCAYLRGLSSPERQKEPVNGNDCKAGRAQY